MKMHVTLGNPFLIAIYSASLLLVGCGAGMHYAHTPATALCLAIAGGVLMAIHDTAIGLIWFWLTARWAHSVIQRNDRIIFAGGSAPATGVDPSASPRTSVNKIPMPQASPSSLWPPNGLESSRSPAVDRPQTFNQPLTIATARGRCDPSGPQARAELTA